MARATNPKPSASERSLSKNPETREAQLLIRNCTRCKAGKKCGHQQNLKNLEAKEKENFKLSELEKKKRNKKN